MLKKARGFTLIELLVVIAIIGVLSAIVLGNLNSARLKGANASIKANLNTVRTQSLIFFEVGNHFGSSWSLGNCPTATQGVGTLFRDQTIFNAIGEAVISGSGTARCGSYPSGSQTTSFAVSVPLKVAEGTNLYWCVDSQGKSKGHPNVITYPGTGPIGCP